MVRVGCRRRSPASDTVSPSESVRMWTCRWDASPCITENGVADSGSAAGMTDLVRYPPSTPILSCQSRSFRSLGFQD